MLVRPSTTLSWVNKGVKLSIEPIKVPNQRTIQKKNVQREYLLRWNGQAEKDVVWVKIKLVEGYILASRARSFKEGGL